MTSALKLPRSHKISLVPPRPLSNKLFPPQEEHVLSLNKNSEGGTKLPTTLDSLAKEHNIHPNLVSQRRDQLDDLVGVYAVSKTHSMAFRGGLHDLFIAFADDIIGFSQQIESSIPKLQDCTNYQDGNTVVDDLVDGLNFALSNLIMKAGHIIDTVIECDGSVHYGDAHVNRVHRQVGELLKTTSFQDDLKTIGEAVPATVSTFLTLQGGLAHILVSLTAVKNKLSSGVRDPNQIYEDQPTESVVRAWADLREKAYEYKKLL